MIPIEQCKNIISKVAWKLGVSPNLITTKLLDDNDKQDMMNGELTREILEIHVKEWLLNDKPDYRKGTKNGR